MERCRQACPGSGLRSIALLLAFLLALIVPMIVAFILGYFTFRNRIKGAFFSILSQALVIITVTLFVGQQGYTGGTNGLTNFTTFLGLNLQSQSTKLLFFYLTLAVVLVVLILMHPARHQPYWATFLLPFGMAKIGFASLAIIQSRIKYSSTAFPQD